MIFSLTGRKYTLQGIERYKKLIFQKFRVGLFYYVADGGGHNKIIVVFSLMQVEANTLGWITLP